MTDEEQLLWRELGQPRKLGFGSQLLDRVDVSPEGLVKAAVVSDVLALGQDSVELENFYNNLIIIIIKALVAFVL